MTEQQKEIIRRMRLEGCSYGQVALKLDMKYMTVKTFCNRNGLTEKILKNVRIVKGIEGQCKYCGEPLVQREKTKKRIFCSRKCREDWWHEHPDMIKKRAIYNFTCANCGKPFTAYGNSGRKYCSHECYIEDRFGEDSE